MIINAENAHAKSEVNFEQCFKINFLGSVVNLTLKMNLYSVHNFHIFCYHFNFFTSMFYDSVSI